MCSSSQSCLRIRRGDEGNMKKQSGFRTFSNSAPRLWNALLHIVREYTFLTDTRKLLFSAKCWVAALTDNPTTLQMFSYFSVSRLGFGLFAVASLTTLLRCEHDSHMNTHALQAHRHHHHLPVCMTVCIPARWESFHGWICPISSGWLSAACTPGHMPWMRWTGSHAFLKSEHSPKWNIIITTYEICFVQSGSV